MKESQIVDYKATWLKYMLKGHIYSKHVKYIHVYAWRKRVHSVIH